MTNNDGAVSRRAVLGGGLGIAAAMTVPSPSRAHGHDDLIALRRDLHAHPEGPGAERRTAGIVARRLRAAGLAVTTGMGGHGVVGVIEGRRPRSTRSARSPARRPPRRPTGSSTPCWCRATR